MLLLNFHHHRLQYHLHHHLVEWHIQTLNFECLHLHFLQTFGYAAALKLLHSPHLFDHGEL